MTQRLFFSWQTDTPTRVGRNFLHTVLEEICEELTAAATVDEAARPVEVDSDTQGVAGQPQIAQTILQKIDDAAVFVADLTLTGKRLDERPTPNPNVLIEYGWALKSLGHQRVLSVMNASYGAPSATNLPFDLAHLRWPMIFTLPEDVTDEAKSIENARFKKALKGAVQASLATLPGSPISAPAEFPAASPKDGPARFRAPGEPLGFDEDLVTGPAHDVYLLAGPAMWLRLMPIVDQEKRWTAKELLRVGTEDSKLYPLRMPAGGYSYVRASDGQGIYRLMGSDANANQSRMTDTVAFAFRTGEIWAIDTGLLERDEKQVPLPHVLELWTKAMDRYRQYLRHLGVDEPYRWNAGLVGVKGRQLIYPPQPGYMKLSHHGPIIAADHIESSGSIGQDESSADALAPLLESIFEECGIELPDYLRTR